MLTENIYFYSFSEFGKANFPTFPLKYGCLLNVLVEKNIKKDA
jgi:hypothetical protein